MTLELDIGGRLRRVSVDRLAGTDTFRFTIEGRVVDVNAAALDSATWSLVLSDGSQHLVGISGTAASGFIVHGAAGDVVVTLPAARRSRRLEHADASADESAPARIMAPMPGKIVRILATIGQEVRAGQGIVVVEAMKMENELRTPRGGVVKEISIAEGSTVEAGALLVIVG
jgi:biotin carboxyl carrier protein